MENNIYSQYKGKHVPNHNNSQKGNKNTKEILLKRKYSKKLSHNIRQYKFALLNNSNEIILERKFTIR